MSTLLFCGRVCVRTQVQAGAREYQASLEDEAEEERRQAEHQLGLLARSNEADSQEVQNKGGIAVATPQHADDHTVCLALL